MTEAMIGWRGYAVSIPGLLVSNQSVVLPRTRAESVCDGRGDAGSALVGIGCVDVPGVMCTCGFYAFRRMEQLWTERYHNQDVICEVWMWGKVAVHDGGLRSQYSYPKAVYPNAGLGLRLADEIGRTYGVPVMPQLQVTPERADMLSMRGMTARALMSEAVNGGDETRRLMAVDIMLDRQAGKRDSDPARGRLVEHLEKMRSDIQFGRMSPRLRGRRR